MSTVIPKEKQSAYERWEMASFGDERPNAKSANQTAVAHLVNQQVESLREHAQREGFQAGFTAGHEDGHRAGFEAGRAEADRQAALLRQLAAAFGNEIATANEVMAEDLLNLALDLAKAMLKTSLAARPELVLPIVGEAIRYLPSVQQPAVLHLHPHDVALVKEHMGDELEKSGWRVAEDLQLARGGCRVETASNQVDATMPTRWQRIAEALGKESDWLA
ncbi:MAG TPA: flagellar assembly protein FliH [Paucimonas sp.]|nr:flagellar assembly protein FliH [Paucimonas sp.]